MYKIGSTLSLVKAVEVQFMFDGSGGDGDEEKTEFWTGWQPTMMWQSQSPRITQLS